MSDSAKPSKKKSVELVRAQGYVWFPLPPHFSDSITSSSSSTAPLSILTYEIRCAIRVLLYSCIRDESLRVIFDGCLLPPPYLTPPVHPPSTLLPAGGANSFSSATDTAETPLTAHQSGSSTFGVDLVELVTESTAAMNDAAAFTAEEVRDAAGRIPPSLIGMVINMPLNFALSTGVYDARLRAAMRKLVQLFSNQVVDTQGILMSFDDVSRGGGGGDGGASSPGATTVAQEPRGVPPSSTPKLGSIEWEMVVANERRLCNIDVSDLAHSEEQQRRATLEAEKKKFPVKRVAIIGVASVIGAAALAVTGGLAAPLVAPALIAVVGATASTLGAAGAIAGALLGGTAIAGVFAAMIGIVTQAAALAALIAPVLSAANLTAIFGVGGAGLAGYRAHTRLGGLDEFVLRPIRDIEWYGLLQLEPFTEHDPHYASVIDFTRHLRDVFHRQSLAGDVSALVEDETEEVDTNGVDTTETRLISEESVSAEVSPEAVLISPVSDDVEMGVTFVGEHYPASLRDIVLTNAKLALSLAGYRRICVFGVENRLRLTGKLNLRLLGAKLSRGIWAHFPALSIPSGSCGVSVCRNRINRPTGCGGIAMYEVQRDDVRKFNSRCTGDSGADDPFVQLEEALVGGVLFIRNFYTFMGNVQISVVFRSAAQIREAAAVASTYVGGADSDGGGPSGIPSLLPAVVTELRQSCHSGTAHFIQRLLPDGELVVEGSCQTHNYLTLRLEPSANRLANRQHVLATPQKDVIDQPNSSFIEGMVCSPTTTSAPSTGGAMMSSSSSSFAPIAANPYASIGSNLKSLHSRATKSAKRVVLLAVANKLFMTAEGVSQSCHVEVESMRTVAGTVLADIPYPSPQPPWHTFAYPFVNDSMIPAPAGGRVVLRVQYRRDTSDPLTTTFVVLDAKINRLDDLRASVCLSLTRPTEATKPTFKTSGFAIGSVVNTTTTEGSGDKRDASTNTTTTTDLPFEIIVTMDSKTKAVLFTLQNKIGQLPDEPIGVVASHAEAKRMALTVAVGGFAGMLDPRVTEADQQVGIWQAGLIREETDAPTVINEHESEVFVLQWESQRQRQFFGLVGVDGESVASRIVTKKASDAAKGQVTDKILKGAVFSAFHAVEALAGAFTLPLYTVWATNRVLDNAYATLRSRAQKAGRELALALMSDLRGNRPVTLIGYSLGASVIFYCLQKLYAVGARAIVENAYLIGSCVEVEFEEWRKAQAVVAGRLVNVFNRSDWTLWALHRANTPGHRPLAGMTQIPLTGVENIDASAVVDCHGQYAVCLRQVIDLIPPFPTEESCRSTSFSSSPGALVPFADLLTAADRVMEAMQDAALLERPRCCIVSHSNRLLGVQQALFESVSSGRNVVTNSAVPLVFIGDVMYGGVFDFAPPASALGGQSGVAGLVSTRDAGVLKRMAANIAKRVSRDDDVVDEEEDPACVCGVYGFAVPLDSITDKYTMVILCFIDFSSNREARAKRKMAPGRYHEVRGVVGGCKVLLVPSKATPTETDHQLGRRLRGIVDHYGADTTLITTLARGGCFSEPIIVEVPVEKGPDGSPLENNNGAVCPIKVAWTQKGEHFTFAVSGVLSTITSMTKQPAPKEVGNSLVENKTDSIAVVEVTPPETHNDHAHPINLGTGLLSPEALAASSRMFSMAMDPKKVGGGPSGLAASLRSPRPQDISQEAPYGKLRVMMHGAEGEEFMRTHPMEAIQEGLGQLQVDYREKGYSLGAGCDSVIIKVGIGKQNHSQQQNTTSLSIDSDVADFDETYNQNLIGLALGEHNKSINDLDDEEDVALAQTLTGVASGPKVFVLWVEGVNTPSVLDKFEVALPLVIVNCYLQEDAHPCILDIRGDALPPPSNGGVAVRTVAPGQCGMVALQWCVEDAQRLLSAHEDAILELISNTPTTTPIDIILDEFTLVKQGGRGVAGAFTVVGRISLEAAGDATTTTAHQDDNNSNTDASTTHSIKIQLLLVPRDKAQLAMDRKKCHVGGNADGGQVPFWEVFVFPQS